MHAARYLPKDADVSALADDRPEGRRRATDLQLGMRSGPPRHGVQNRSHAEPASVKDWGKTLACRLLESVAENETGWAAFGRDGMRGRPWRIEPRNSADGPRHQPFLSSLASGRNAIPGWCVPANS